MFSSLGPNITDVCLPVKKNILDNNVFIRIYISMIDNPMGHFWFLYLVD